MSTMCVPHNAVQANTVNEEDSERNHASLVWIHRENIMHMGWNNPHVPSPCP